ncbi:hypothetical protein BS78_05G246300 [Paspalum vaginatum]|nr:hypothetical protein BS78_05G246300 [Paspalum vaginatum]
MFLRGHTHNTYLSRCSTSIVKGEGAEALSSYMAFVNTGTARIVELMAASFLVLAILSSNPLFCQACFGRFCGRPPCFRPTEKDYCTQEICQHACALNDVPTKLAYCKESVKMCCCPLKR